MAESLEGLQMIVLLDQHERWQQGERPLVESYLLQIPDLSSDSQRLLDVIYQEVLLREAAGDKPKLDEYLQRFPELADELRIQFEVHESMPQQIDPGPIAEEISFPTIVGYRIDKELGRGTFGVVYQAWELALQRPIAIKVIPFDLAGVDFGDEFSFSEAQAIAQLTHPNIVPIHSVGTTGEGVYFSQDLLTDGTLADFSPSKPMPPREAAECVAVLADAVHYAHLRRLVHCDLKPANILLRSKNTQSRGSAVRSLSDFDPLVTDFGLAMHLDADSRVCNGHLRGTLHYMAPEQTGAKGAAIGPATDVYALGAIIYELLTGRAPFAGLSKLNTFLEIRQKQPIAPVRLCRGIHPDLNAICLKCLEKDPTARYSSAAELAADLRRYLGGFAPLAVTTNLAGHFTRWCRRSPLVAALILALVVITIGSFAAVTQKMRQAQLAERRERQRADELDAALYRNQFHLAVKAWEMADIGQAIRILEDAKPRFRSFEWHHLYRLCTTLGRKIAWEGDPVSDVVVSPDGQTLAVSDHETISLIDRVTGKLKHKLVDQGLRLTKPVFHPAGTCVAVARMDQNISWIELWDTSSGQQLRRIGPLLGPPLDLIFTSQGNQIVSLARATEIPTMKADELIALFSGRQPPQNTESEQRNPVIKLGELVIDNWETASGRRLDRFNGPATGGYLFLAAKLSSDGRWLAWTPGHDLPIGTALRNEIELISAKTGKVACRLNSHTDRITALAFSPDGEKLATFDNRKSGFVWSTSTGERLYEIVGLDDAILTACFSTDGNVLVTGGRDQKVTRFDARTGKRLQVFRGHHNFVSALDIGPDDAFIVSVDRHSEIREWTCTNSGKKVFQYLGAISCLGFESSSDRLWFSDLQGNCQLLDLKQDDARLSSESPVHAGLAFAIDSKHDQIAVVDQNRLRMGSVREQAEWSQIESTAVSAFGTSPIVFSGDGKTLAVLDANRQSVILIDANSKKIMGRLKSPGPRMLGLSSTSDSAWLAVAADNQTIQIWDLRRRELARTIQTDFAIREMAIHPGSHEIVAIGTKTISLNESFEAFFQIWNFDSAEPEPPIVAHKARISRIRFTPDGKRLITGSSDTTVKIWDWSSREELWTLTNLVDDVRELAVSADGMRLAIGCGMTVVEATIVILSGADDEH